MLWRSLAFRLIVAFDLRFYAVIFLGTLALFLCDMLCEKAACRAAPACGPSVQLVPFVRTWVARLRAMREENRTVVRCTTLSLFASLHELMVLVLCHDVWRLYGTDVCVTSRVWRCLVVSAHAWHVCRSVGGFEVASRSPSPAHANC